MEDNKDIYVAIVDDDEVFRKSIVEYLKTQDNIFINIEADSMETFLHNIRKLPTLDVILLDIGLPGMSGIAGMKLIKEKYEDVSIVMLTVHDDSNKIFSALRAGASGYLLKSTPLSKLNSFIEMLSQGGAPMSHQIAFKVVQHFQTGKKNKKKSPLSDREKEVVSAIVDGLSYKQIAERLCISMGTIHTHIRNIYKKLHAHSKADVITKFMRGEI